MLIPTAFGKDKLFVEVPEPYEYKDFVVAGKTTKKITILNISFL